MAVPFTLNIFVNLGRRWSVEVGGQELLAVKPANLVVVSVLAATYVTTVGFYGILLQPDGTISCGGTVGCYDRFYGPNSPPPPAPVALEALPLEAQLSVFCSFQKPSAEMVQSILSRMPPATVNELRIPGISLTLLEFAARNGQLQVVQTLLSFGADVNIQTPCLWAAFTGSTQIIETLMQRGAVPARERDPNGVSTSISFFFASQCSAHLTCEFRNHRCIMQRAVIQWTLFDFWCEKVATCLPLTTVDKLLLMSSRLVT